MNLFSFLAGLPLVPVRGVVRVAELVRDQADQQLYSPASARQQLEEIDEARRKGEVSERKAAETEERIVGRVIGGPAAGTGDSERT